MRFVSASVDSVHGCCATLSVSFEVAVLGMQGIVNAPLKLVLPSEHLLSNVRNSLNLTLPSNTASERSNTRQPSSYPMRRWYSNYNLLAVRCQVLALDGSDVSTVALNYARSLGGLLVVRCRQLNPSS